MPEAAQSIRLNQIPKERIRHYWPFVERGARDIVRKITPAPDWQPPDLFNALCVGGATLWVAERDERMLGWFAGYPQKRPFSQTSEFFLWAVWTLPLRERLPDDDFAEVIRLSRECWKEQKRECSGDRIVMLSSREGFERYGFKKGHTAWYLE